MARLERGDKPLTPVVHRRAGAARTACGLALPGRRAIASYERTTAHHPLCDNCWRLKRRNVHAFVSTTFFPSGP